LFGLLICSRSWELTLHRSLDWIFHIFYLSYSGIKFRPHLKHWPGCVSWKLLMLSESVSVGRPEVSNFSPFKPVSAYLRLVSNFQFQSHCFRRGFNLTRKLMTCQRMSAEDHFVCISKAVLISDRNKGTCITEKIVTVMTFHRWKKRTNY
jgi:hypothetical protein